MDLFALFPVKLQWRSIRTRVDCVFAGAEEVWTYLRAEKKQMEATPYKYGNCCKSRFVFNFTPSYLMSIVHILAERPRAMANKGVQGVCPVNKRPHQVQGPNSGHPGAAEYTFTSRAGFRGNNHGHNAG